MRFYPRHTINLNRKIFKLLATKIVSNQLLAGPQIVEFERQFSDYVGSKFALGVAQARLGLIAVLQALGLNSGDQVILSCFNFHVIAEAVVKLGLVPVFIDVDPDSYNINPQLIRNRITEQTRAIIVTHMFGNPARMDEIMQLAKEKQVKVIEDCAHALGSTYKGRKVGTFGDAGIFSFGAGKNMPCFSGGMIATNDRQLIVKLKQKIISSGFPSRTRLMTNVVKHSLSCLLTSPPTFNLFTFPLIRILDLFNTDLVELIRRESLPVAIRADVVNIAFRLTNLQAAVGLVNFNTLELFNDKRIANSALLSKNLSGLSGIKLQRIDPQTKSIYSHYKIRVKDKHSFRKRLLQRRIDASKREEMSACAECRHAASLAGELIEIPNSHLLTSRDINKIASAIKELTHGT